MRLRPRKPLERRRRISAQNSGATAWRGANGFSSPSCVTNSDALSRRRVYAATRDRGLRRRDESRRRIRAATKILARAQRFALSRAFDGWVWRASEKRRHRALAQRATERLTKNAKAMTFREWRRTARENIEAQAAKAAREEAENLRKSLDATTAEARATTTESVDAAVAAKIHAANLQVQLDVANADAAEASRSALDEAQAAKTAREEAENLRAKLWRDRVARSERFLLALMRHKLRRAFASWSTTTRESRRRIRAATKILARAQRFALSRAFDGWVWRASEKRRHRALAQRATERLTKNAKAMTFREWRRTARENIEAQAAKAAREEAENLRKSLDATTAEARATTTESVDAAVAAKIHAANLQVQLDVANADAAEASRSALDEAQAAKTAREEAENLRAKLWRDRVARSERFLPRPHASTNSDAHSRRGLRRRASRDDEFAPRRKFSRVRNGLPFRARSTDGCGARARNGAIARWRNAQRSV